MSLASDFILHADSGFSGIWVVTDEVFDAQDEIIKQANKSRLLCLSWTLDEGVRARDDWTIARLKRDKGLLAPIDKPDDMLAKLPELAFEFLVEQQKNPSPDGGGDVKPIGRDAQRFVLLLPNFHLKPFIESAKLTQQLARLPLVGRAIQFVIVILSHSAKIPAEYEKQFVILKHCLPGDAELTRIATKIGRDVAADGVRAAVQSARGLTRIEAENAFALTSQRGKVLDPQMVWDLKAQTIEKSGLMTIYRGDATTDRMGGLDYFFSYAQSLLTGYTGENPLLMPRGLLLVGVPGGGKSEAVKCLANRVKRPLIMLDVGRLMGGLVGETETNTRRALAIADAMSPCILMVDEIEKALGGAAGGGGRNDSGVGLRMLGTLLTWLNDHTTDVFFMGTCNEVENLPSALTRAERFDAKFFFDFPNAEARKAIWEIYFKLFELPSPETGADMLVDLLKLSEDWTGAEIRSCCRLAAIQKRTVWDMAKTIVPVSKMYSEDIKKLRAWAQGNCLASNQEGIYTVPARESFESMIGVIPGSRPMLTDGRVIKKKKKLNLGVKSP